MLRGETIAAGAPDVRPTCATQLRLNVLRSAAGFYIGSQCDCGPYSRESGYFSTREQAEASLSTGNFGR
jgi:hypothetical protein